MEVVREDAAMSHLDYSLVTAEKIGFASLGTVGQAGTAARRGPPESIRSASPLTILDCSLCSLWVGKGKLSLVEEGVFS